MAIAFDRYVRITSAVGGGGEVRRRDLIARLFTPNVLAPVGMILEFTNANSVRDYFGSDSQEFLRAQFYFSFISKTITSPSRISFARFVNTASPPRIFGDDHQTLEQLKEITGGTFSLTLGDETLDITVLNFSSDTSFSDIADTLQTAIRTGTSTNFTAATVTYNATSQRFEMVGGEAVDSVIRVDPGSTNDASGAIGWLGNAVFSDGSVIQSITDTLVDTSELSNNFGSFSFVNTLTNDQIIEAGRWNDSQNVLYQYHVPVTVNNSQTLSAALINFGGIGLTLTDTKVSNEYPEMLPMSILASTDYTARASTQNYMFYEAALTPTVTTTADANIYDNQRVNYYGQTQTAGILRSFYQRGVLTGLDTDPVDMNTYANEQWLKDDAGVGIMSVLLSLPRVPANQTGKAQVLIAVQSTIDRALNNGSISIGRTLTNTQRLFITTQSGDPLAFHQVMSSGYWVTVSIESFQTQDGRTEFRANYTLIYAQDNAVRMVEGRHILI